MYEGINQGFVTGAEMEVNGDMLTEISDLWDTWDKEAWNAPPLKSEILKLSFLLTTFYPLVPLHLILGSI